VPSVCEAGVDRLADSMPDAFPLPDPPLTDGELVLGQPVETKGRRWSPAACSQTAEDLDR
jgi:hypothetical protein